MWAGTLDYTSSYFALDMISNHVKVPSDFHWPLTSASVLRWFRRRGIEVAWDGDDGNEIHVEKKISHIPT